MPKKLETEVIRQTAKQFQTVKKLVQRQDVKEIVIATDAGREGELVARWILKEARNQKPCRRLWVSSVTDKAIRDGFAHLKNSKEYDPLYRAAVSRAEADWLVGINATDVKVNETEDNIDIKVDYKLEVNYEHLAECSISMNIMSKDTKDFRI